MTQLSLPLDVPLLQGRLNGVNWCSMTTVGRAQSKMLQLMLNRHNTDRQRFGFSPVGVAEMLRVKFGMTLSVWLKKKFSARSYYLSLSSYNNQKPVL